MADEPEPKELPKELLDRIEKVDNKRARFVLDTIVKRGMITTEELQQQGYEHAPRAAKDARDLGFGLKTIRVKHSNGRSIGAYVFDEEMFAVGKTGRRAMPKKERDALIQAGGNECRMCRAKENLQVDHRVPFEVAGESQHGEEEPYQILDGACNRKKSWTCEHCTNWLALKKVDVCLSCYWVSPDSYTHVAMQQQRQAELIWIGDEVGAYDRLKLEAERNGRTVPEQIKAMLDTTQKP